MKTVSRNGYTHTVNFHIDYSTDRFGLVEPKFMLRFANEELDGVAPQTVSLILSLKTLITQ